MQLGDVVAPDLGPPVLGHMVHCERSRRNCIDGGYGERYDGQGSGSKRDTGPKGQVSKEGSSIFERLMTSRKERVSVRERCSASIGKLRDLKSRGIRTEGFHDERFTKSYG